MLLRLPDIVLDFSQDVYKRQRKEGSAYDLPLAIGLLGANETISSEKFSRYLLMGELSLDGSIQPIKGALPIAIKAREDGFEGLILSLIHI